MPASSVVRMNNASNMIAKWYQKASAAPPSQRPKIAAMPTARLGAPPVRAKSVLSPIAVASACIFSGVTGKPQPVIVAEAAAGSAPTTPAGLLIAK